MDRSLSVVLLGLVSHVFPASIVLTIVPSSPTAKPMFSFIKKILLSVFSVPDFKEIQFPPPLVVLVIMPPYPAQ